MKLEPQRSENMAAQTGIGRDEKIVTLFRPDGGVAQEYFENFRKKLSGPEKALFLAVLEDGIRCFQDNVFAESERKKILFQDAEMWLFGDHSEWLFSFASVCAALDLDPGYLRRGLRSWQERARSEPRNKPSPVRENGAAGCDLHGNRCAIYSSENGAA